mgnify:CR=1 FL=1|jgi:hypothetical protein|tara:strand:- start:13541 stop:14905 length:1365 start_codon:yes stop_codon:yes gene_type:complete
MGLLNQTQNFYYNSGEHGSYQFVSLDNIIKQFMIVYVGEDKIISKASRTDIAFHAQRALAELSFDTFKSFKSQEITVPATLQMTLPQDYVNYTKISSVDSAGIKHPLYPTNRTSNPFNPLQNSDGEFKLQAIGNVDDDSDVETGVIGTILLDGEYKDILVGMYVSGPYVDGLRVIKVSNSGGATTITVGTISGTTYTPVAPDDTFNGATLTFTNVDNNLILPQKSSFIVENLDWRVDDNIINFNSTSDISSIEIGMLIYHEDFPLGTFVKNISTIDLKILVSERSLNVATNNSEEITFISPDVESDTWSNYKSQTPSENNNDDYEDDVYWKMQGERYGLDPQHAQVNGSFYIDQVSGKIHFSSNINGKTVILDYISDSLGTDSEMQVHKFAEEAMYKYIAHAVLSGKSNIPEYQVNRFKKERFAAVRTAKLRLSNLKLEELTQVLRGKSKQIKH